MVAAINQYLAIWWTRQSYAAHGVIGFVMNELFVVNINNEFEN